MLSTKSNFPFVIAGPCSAETEEQVHNTIDQIVAASNRVSMLRAGIWKPRTRPNAFEGVGEVGLKWLKDAGKKVNLPVTTEVANAKHVELALEAGIDCLWIGARTTVSPFIVQEIADSLKGVNVPVFVKNPVNPDLGLWIGAIERFEKSGITDIRAIHRGFSTYQKGIYRNPPIWEIPIELRRQRPDIPIICDPSHICGKRVLLKEVSQQAIDLKFDGLMIETHQNPDEAWSDAAQQLTPKALSEMLESLVLRQNEVISNGDHDALSTQRAEIDRIDNYILELLSERMNIAEEIGKFKLLNDIAIHQPIRWANTVKHAIDIGKNNGLTEDFIIQLFQKIHNESIGRQSKVMKG